MPIGLQRITPCLWFDSQAEEAARFYVSVFPNSGIGTISRYGTEGHEIHGRPAGSVMTVEFEIEGQTFVALNGGPHFRFSEAISFQVHCDTQDEIDFYWERLSEGGEEGPCGWLKDRFGLSWQIVPRRLTELMSDPDTTRAKRAMEAMMQMKRIDIAALERAADAEPVA
jgi:predicted 3-demethylubiquinone-9 3-methyltransferase (glyoxalase superfamily)